ncbi:uncharacterized protein LOC120320434 isoform X2 [Drosophila yakuba]|uniref:uncharacterized protein LOC120320434 isoform X2 n=1 Tax=Drosophila yakuba TaxID=7245 RepID=UPI001930784B|nr:uncharacterized protein LOC120320434 isoform X2 [Drosophila yakuba]
MLQPREDNEISDIYNKKCDISTFTRRMIYSTYYHLIMFTTILLTMVHIETSQAINQSYHVSPTPSLPAITGDDITTVLLVNNESGHVADFHGRFLTVRPEIGVLTSTARTFIQDGITTEFATKILGTTLNNGRLYAQYLKKSSRVLYENENVAPSVVTSWHLLIQQQQESLAQAISNTTPSQVLLGENLQILDDGTRSSIKSDAIDIIEYDSDLVSVSNEPQVTKSHRKKSRKTSSGNKRSKNQEPSVITLYVSGRRPGEFSTVLSTVRSDYDHSVSLQKRHAILEIQPTNSMNYVSNTEKSKNIIEKNLIFKDLRSSLTNEFGFNEFTDQTASLESIVGDVHLWFANSNGQSTTMTTSIKSVVI